MGISLTLEESDFAGYIDDGDIFPAVLSEVKLVEKPFIDDKTGEKVKKISFKFRIDQPGDPHDGDFKWGETGTRFNTHPECRLKNWAEAVLGRTLERGYQLETDDLLDKECRVVIGRRDYEKDGETKVYNFVKDVMPSAENMKAFANRDALDDPEPF